METLKLEQIKRNEPKGRIKRVREFIFNKIPRGEYIKNRTLMSELKIPRGSWDKIAISPYLSEFRVKHNSTKQVFWGNPEDIEKLKIAMEVS